MKKLSKTSSPCNSAFWILVSVSGFLVDFSSKPLVMRARQNARTESAKLRNRRMQKKVVSPCKFISWGICNNSLVGFLILWSHGFLLVDQYNGTPKKPRLSVFCSDKQLYAMLVDDQNNKCLFYGSTLQKSIRQDPHCSTAVSSPCLCNYFNPSSLFGCRMVLYSIANLSMLH